MNMSSLDVQLLPSSSHVEDHLTGRRKRCAVVGSSGVLLGSKLGTLIDGHDQVIRVHPAVTRGFVDDVGRRTTVHFMRGRRGHLATFDRLSLSQPEGKVSEPHLLLYLLPPTSSLLHPALGACMRQHTGAGSVLRRAGCLNPVLAASARPGRADDGR